MSTVNSNRTKAFLAIAFASGSGSVILPSVSAGKTQMAQTVIQRIELANVTPPLKAYNLLRNAEREIDNGTNEADIDLKDFTQPLRTTTLGRFRINDELIAWTNKLNAELKVATHNSNETSACSVNYKALNAECGMG